jgi:2-isopropylmalate synthase
MAISPRLSDPNRVLIFDTTLRDGEQSPGCSMTLPEKLRVARALAELGVDIIEAGFPAASPGDFAAVQTIAREVHGAMVAGLARCAADDIDKAYRAIKEAPRRRLHVFLATSAIHREHKLNMAKSEIIQTAVDSVRLARSLTEDVEFSPEDASRTEHEFLAEVVEAVIAAGASTVNIPDTVGYTTPQEFGELFQYLKRHVRGIDQVVLSVHCHNDLGMAVANSLTAVQNGARQIECTINGLGERAGNCSLEEVVMAIKTRAALYGVHTGIHTPRLYPTARLVSTITGMPIPRNKAITGENAFAHEAGIHQHGVLRHAATYEIMRPDDIGLARNSLVLGKHSGRHAFRERVKALGFELDEDELNRVFAEFKALADRKKELFDGDIEALVLRTGESAGPWHLEQLWTSAVSGTQAAAVVRLKHSDGRSLEQGASGDGPVDAAFKAMEAITGVTVQLRKFEVHSVTQGEDAQGEAVVDVEHGGRRYRGSSLTTNIVESGARAFLEVLNRIENSREPRREAARLARSAPATA